jgi:hypothetical protein
MHRPGFDDKALTDELRSVRIIIKGRFQGGTVSYVRAEDLELYAIACRKPLARLNARQQAVLQAIQNLGEATPRQIKEETGLRNKEIMPALHRLQEAFIVPALWLKPPSFRRDRFQRVADLALWYELSRWQPYQI